MQRRCVPLPPCTRILSRCASGTRLVVSWHNPRLRLQACFCPHTRLAGPLRCQETTGARCSTKAPRTRRRRCVSPKPGPLRARTLALCLAHAVPAARRPVVCVELTCHTSRAQPAEPQTMLEDWTTEEGWYLHEQGVRKTWRSAIDHLYTWSVPETRSVASDLLDIPVEIPTGIPLTALMLAAQNDNVRVVSLLLSMGVRWDHVAANGKSALDYAVSDEVRSLLQNARPVAEQLALNMRLLLAAAYREAANLKEALTHGRVFLEAREGWRSNIKGFSAFHHAAAHGSLDMTEALLAAGAYIEEPTFDDDTPLILAAQRGHYDVVAFLLASGADIERVNNGALHLSIPLSTTPLGHAVEAGCADVVEQLIKAGANTLISVRVHRLAEAPKVMPIMDRAGYFVGFASASPSKLADRRAILRLLVVSYAESPAPALPTASAKADAHPAAPAPEVVSLLSASDDDEPAAAPPPGDSSALAAMTRRAEAAEATQQRLVAEKGVLAARVCELEREARAATLGKRSAEAHLAAAQRTVKVKLERVETATAAAATATAAAASAAQALQQVETELDTVTMCCICLSAPRRMLFAPCFHLAGCAECVDNMRRAKAEELTIAQRRKGAAPKLECPMCRTPTDTVMGPVFM